MHKQQYIFRQRQLYIDGFKQKDVIQFITHHIYISSTLTRWYGTEENIFLHNVSCDANILIW